MASEVETRKSIIKIFQEHPECSFIKIAREAGVCRKTVSIVIRRFKEDSTINRKEGSGRKKGFQSPKTAKEGIRGNDRDHHKKYDGEDSRKKLKIFVKSSF